MSRLSASDFSIAMGITVQAARLAMARCADGKTWNGLHLPVVEIAGQRGGASGRTWGLDLDALDPELRALFQPASTDVKNFIHQLFDDGFSEGAIGLARWRWSIVSDAAALPIGPARAAEVARITAQTYHLEGKDVSVSKSTAYQWLALYADGGFKALVLGGRADRGKRRVGITRKWDAGIDLEEDARTKIIDTMTAYGKSFVRSDASLRKLAMVGARKLVEMCRAEGSQLTAPQLTALCKLNSKWSGQFAQFKRVARKERDAKAHFDKDQPRIGRHRSPMCESRRQTGPRKRWDYLTVAE